MVNVTRSVLSECFLYVFRYAGVILHVLVWVFFVTHGCVRVGICSQFKQKICFENKSYPIYAPWNISKPQQTDISLLIVEDVSVF